MSTTGWVIVAIVVVVIVVALVALMAWRAQHRRQMTARAHALRHEAVSRAPQIDENRQEAREAEVRAEAARLEAERAQREAEAAKTTLAQEEAAHEDKLREADRLDPAVDHRADDYEPTAPDGVSSATEEGYRPAPGGAHRAEE
jgi:FtsZ-interacting cell division protein ZipA